MSRTYSREEVDEILRRAAQRGGPGEPTLSREELVDAAREAGIDPDAVHAAADEVDTGVALERIPTEDEAVAAWQARRRRRFTTHALTWLVVCGGLLLINLLAGGALWFQWPLASWGILVALQAIGTFQSATPDQLERVKERHRKKTQEARKRVEKQQRKLEAAQRSEAQRRAKEQRKEDRARRQDTAAMFEAAVEEGVAALMEAATRTISEVSKRSRKAERAVPKKQTDFDRYVAKRKGAAEPQRVALRVDTGGGARPVDTGGGAKPVDTGGGAKPVDATLEERLADELDDDGAEEEVGRRQRR